MTAANLELVKVGGSLLVNRNAQLLLPEYCTPTEVNTSIPSPTDILTESDHALYPVSTQLKVGGKIFRYCKAGAAMTAHGFMKGNYIQCPGKAGNSGSSGFEGALYAAVAAGDTEFKIADTAAAKNLYQGATLVIYNDTDAIYETHTVIANEVDNDTTTTCYIAEPGFMNAITTSMGITIYLDPFSSIRTMTGGYMSAMGWANFSITSAYYFWMQTAGIITGVTGASTWPGQTQYYRDVYCNTDGSLLTYSAGYQRVGYLLSRTASDYGDNFIMLQLDQ
jgi:hypothetical protein